MEKIKYNNNNSKLLEKKNMIRLLWEKIRNMTLSLSSKKKAKCLKKLRKKCLDRRIMKKMQLKLK